MEETCVVPSIVWPLWLLAAIPMTVVGDWLTQWMVRVYRHAGGWRAVYASILPRSAIRYGGVVALCFVPLLTILWIQRCGSTGESSVGRIVLIVLGGAAVLAGALIMTVLHARANRSPSAAADARGGQLIEQRALRRHAISRSALPLLGGTGLLIAGLLLV